ncbi:flagellar hook-basal body complex protein, partial [Photobacterium damselae subsp. damselae]|nr:flagellar hook-basal body complex protein [Photobacterium damselae subsp. damselae]
MSVNIALSGLGAAQKDLNTTSNNIANANTYGFKESRAEFGDVYSNSIFSNAKTSTGGGVQTSTVAQQFHEGSSLYTNNPLDLRISGAGFFAVADNKAEPANNSLTRNGAFHLNNQNELVNSEGKFLLGYDVNSDTNTVSSYEPKSMKIDDVFGKPTPSKNMDISLNLPNKETTPKNHPFNFDDKDSYSRSTSSTIYDSLGKPYKMNTYYVAKYNPADPTTANTWEVYHTVTNPSGKELPLDVDATKLDPTFVANGAAAHKGYIMKFDTSGQLQASSPSVIDMVNFKKAGIDVGGADDSQALTMNYKEPTQYASPFEVRQ